MIKEKIESKTIADASENISVSPAKKDKISPNGKRDVSCLETKATQDGTGYCQV